MGGANRAATTRRPGNRVAAMTLNIERIEWMPSPPLAPDDGPIDSGPLRRMTLGDTELEREVLAMFAAQTAGLMDRLQPVPCDGMMLAHTLKGSARGIGAFRVADAAEWLEEALRHGEDPARALSGVNEAVAEARTAIDALLRRS